MNSFTGIFQQHLKPRAPPCIYLSPPPSNFEELPPMFSTPVGNPDAICLPFYKHDPNTIDEIHMNFFMFCKKFCIAKIEK